MRFKNFPTAALVSALAVLPLAGCRPPAPPVARPTPTPSASALPSPSPSPPAPAPVALARTSFLGTSFLAPAGWSRRATINGAEDGFVTYATAGGYSVYLEVNNCAACVDEGLVLQGVANGVPYPNKVLSQYGALSERPLSHTRTAFTSRLYGSGPLQHSVLVIVVSQVVSGYVVLQVALPPGNAVATERILASLTVPASLGPGS